MMHNKTSTFIIEAYSLREDYKSCILCLSSHYTDTVLSNYLQWVEGFCITINAKENTTCLYI